MQRIRRTQHDDVNAVLSTQCVKTFGLVPERAEPVGRDPIDDHAPVHQCRESGSRVLFYCRNVAPGHIPDTNDGEPGRGHAMEIRSATYG
jgi:hypothetical protein